MIRAKREGEPEVHFKQKFQRINSGIKMAAEEGGIFAYPGNDALALTPFKFQQDFSTFYPLGKVN